jgi:PKD repeat protein
MKKFYSLALLLTIFAVNLNVFTSYAQHQKVFDKCIAEVMFKEQIKADPDFALKQQQLEQETRDFIPQYVQRLNASGQKNASVVKIIPVVFHIIHEGGLENISRAQVIDQLDSLNKDFRRMNADTADTPVPFKPIGADSEIEFRLATLDPNGNCTDGVVRVYSPLTNNARNNVKALSYWPSNKYLNIWVVKSIENVNGTPGMVIGFAQFPGGSAATDGVVLKYDFTGSIGPAAGSGNAGRTATHEVGHWLNLRHIWGDANCGSDFVTDTPTQEGAHSGCPSHPYHVNMCGPGTSPNGEMYSNYMDYTNGDCQNIFTNNQAARMNAALSSGISGRNNLWTQANLIATGTDGTPGVLCAPVAAFNNNVRTICEGATLLFSDGSWNGTIDTYAWDFPGGTPSTSSLQNPQVQYNTAGTYDASLTVTNAAGTSSVTYNGVVIVVPAIGQYAVPYNEGFESIFFPGNEWSVENEAGNMWEQNSLAAHSGVNSVYINNFSGNPSGTDVFITPTFNLTNVTNANLYFWLAFAARSTTSTDQLKVFASTSCGQIWNIRYNNSGLNLATAGIINQNFFPTAAQWRQETVNIASTSYNNKPNVRFKFEYVQGNGNNIFIDDLNLDGTVGLNEVMEEALQFSVYPNPVISYATVDFTLEHRSDIKIDVVDVLGRIVNEIETTTLDAGEYQFELPGNVAPGLYSVRLHVDGYVTSRKILIN